MTSRGDVNVVIKNYSQFNDPSSVMRDGKVDTIVRWAKCR
jgi:hypothetical protein